MIARAVGRVIALGLQSVEARLPCAALGDRVRVLAARGAVEATVEAVSAERVRLLPCGALDGVAPGDRVEGDLRGVVAPGPALLGRAIDARGEALDGGDPARRAPSAASTLRPCERGAIREPLWTGVRTIDALLTIGRGARIGIFGAPGAGKSTLLERIAREASSDAIVVGLVGERGREAERWLRARDARTTIVCATSDRPPAERVAAADLALRQAEALRTRGLAVLLIVDSLARTAAAWRESALAAGELPARGGYPPSVFSRLAGLVERAGATPAGSVTLVATVLSDGPEEQDPLAEAVRSLLDGHLVLDAGLARSGRFPALDVLRSASRTMPEICSPEHLAAAGRVRAALAALAESRELREAGLWQPGADAALDRAVAALPALEAFRFDAEPSPGERSLDELLALADML